MRNFSGFFNFKLKEREKKKRERGGGNELGARLIKINIFLKNNFRNQNFNLRSFSRAKVKSVASGFLNSPEISAGSYKFTNGRKLSGKRAAGEILSEASVAPSTEYESRTFVPYLLAASARNPCIRLRLLFLSFNFYFFTF